MPTRVQLNASDLSDPAKVQAFKNAQARLTQAIIPLQRLQEAYPDLKSNQNFLALQDQLEGTENRINASRRDYNAAVQAYNTRIRTFPDAIGAKIFYGAKPKVPFEARPRPRRQRRRSLSQRAAEVKQLLAALWLAFVALATPAAAQTFPQLTGRVVDQAHLLQRRAGRRPDQQVGSAGGADRPPVRGRDRQQPRRLSDRGLCLPARPRVEDRHRQRTNNGVLLLVAPNERKVWIATGYGAGGFLTDAMSGRDHARERSCRTSSRSRPITGGGIEAGADAIIKQMSLPPDEAQKNVAAAEQAQQQRQHSGGSPLPVIFWLMVIGFVVLSHFRRGAGRRYRTRAAAASARGSCCGASMNSAAAPAAAGAADRPGAAVAAGGGGGGGFGGFSGGGGSFGGGGAGGSW